MQLDVVRGAEGTFALPVLMRSCHGTSASRRRTRHREGRTLRLGPRPRHGPVAGVDSRGATDDGQRPTETPDEGIASSLRVGLETLAEAAPDVEGAFVVLGDQPRLRSATLADLAIGASATDRPLIVPRYEDDPGPRDSVLIRRSAWPLVAEMRDDHGLAPVIAVHPELVWDVRVAEVMPDVDRPEDLERLRLSSDRLAPGRAARARAYPSSPG